MSQEQWRNARWYIALNGIADAWLWGFDADGRWRLRHGNPARGTLALLPIPGGRKATLEEALWIADCIAFDHDAPVGLLPPSWNRRLGRLPEPVTPPPGPMKRWWYFEDVRQGHAAAAEIRFGESYVIRYDDGRRSPGTDYSTRFRGRENLVALYAMASRQADLLTEYLCLYRVLEAADNRNGKTFATANLPRLRGYDFGVLPIIRGQSKRGYVNAFAVYRRRAVRHLQDLASHGVITDADVAHRLYELRNSLAHGKHGTFVADYGSQLAEIGAALPVVKLLARIAVEGK